MARGAHIFPRPRSAAPAREAERLALLESMRQTRLLLHQAYTGFNAVGDPDLIEAYVYEINALQARYSYLLRQVRAMESLPAAAAP